MPDFVVRDAIRADYPAMARIFRKASLANAGDRAALLTHPDALVLSDELIGTGRARVAVIAGGIIVGFASARPTELGALELDDVFVDPGWQRRGAGRRLIEHIADEAGREHFTGIGVTANPHALQFYRAAGFVAAGETHTEFGRGIRMHLEITPPGPGPEM